MCHVSDGSGVGVLRGRYVRRYYYTDCTRPAVFQLLVRVTDIKCTQSEGQLNGTTFFFFHVHMVNESVVCVFKQKSVPKQSKQKKYERTGTDLLVKFLHFVTGKNCKKSNNNKYIRGTLGPRATHRSALFYSRFFFSTSLQVRK